MKQHLRTLAPVLLSLFFGVIGTVRANAQITNEIRAHVNHSFMVGDKTLPAGDYTFRIESSYEIMIMQNKNGDNVAEFTVRESVDNHTPKHSELVFRKYGNTEFLSKIYEIGSKDGVALTESSKEESRLANQGQHGMEHAEEQP